MEKTVFEKVKDRAVQVMQEMTGDDFAVDYNNRETDVTFKCWEIACKIVELELYARAHVVDVNQGASALEFIGMELKNLATKD